MANKRINMFGMPWVEWKNLSGLTDPYTALSVEQGVPQTSDELMEGKENPRSYMPKPSKQTTKQQRLGLIVKRARKMAGKRGSDVLAKYAATAAAKKKAEINSCREALADAIGEHYDELFSEFVNAGGDSVEEFHGCLNYAFDEIEEGIVEEVCEDLLWEEFLVMKGLTLEAFHQLMDAALVTEDEDEMISLLALQDMFESEKKDKLIKPPDATSKKSGVTIKGFKSLVGPHPAVSPSKAGDTINWGAYGGVQRIKKPDNSSVDYGDVAAVTEDEDVLWEEFLSERGITVGQFHQLMDEAIASGDVDEMETLAQLDEIFDFWKKKKAKLAPKAMWDKAREVQKTHGIEMTRAATNRGTQVGVKSRVVGGGTSVSK